MGLLQAHKELSCENQARKGTSLTQREWTRCTMGDTVLPRLVHPRTIMLTTFLVKKHYYFLAIREILGIYEQ